MTRDLVAWTLRHYAWNVQNPVMDSSWQTDMTLNFAWENSQLQLHTLSPISFALSLAAPSRSSMVVSGSFMACITERTLWIVPSGCRRPGAEPTAGDQNADRSGSGTTAEP